MNWLTGAIRKVIAALSCSAHSRSKQPRPYIIAESGTGKWIIAIDALNNEEIFREGGYASAGAALDAYEFAHGHMKNGSAIPHIEMGADGKFKWNWSGFQSEQSFYSPFAARHNWDICKAAIVAHDDPLMINHKTL